MSHRGVFIAPIKWALTPHKAKIKLACNEMYVMEFIQIALKNFKRITISFRNWLHKIHRQERP